MSQDADMRSTLGAVLTGAFFATALSGSVCLQTFLYIRHYPNDYKNLKALVAATWGMDTAQTICITTLCYQYMTLNFTRPEIAGYIFRTVAASIALTALLTVTVNGFFCHRVHKLSRGNWWLTVPTIFCLAARLGLAIATSIETSKLQSFKLYGHRFRWLLTSALALSATSDVIVTAGLCYYLRRLNRGMYSTQKMMSTIFAFAINDGALTCLVALVTLTCWLAMPNNLVYLGVHFTIGKFNSNSLLATLNMRDYIKRSAGGAVGVVNVMNSVAGQTAYPMATRGATHWPGAEGGITGAPFYEEEQSKLAHADGAGPLQIKVDTTVHYDQLPRESLPR